ncbi:MAG: hypothetical protein A4E74_00666 [Syntrophus sp. PtaB.Bin075]|jgi:alpha-galactosidase|nr:MAG: hypothetical protein A4E74_00666 [Syntrophus sp. PtaB.Bin075]
MMIKQSEWTRSSCPCPFVFKMVTMRKRAKITGMRIMGGEADTISQSDEEKGA